MNIYSERIDELRRLMEQRGIGLYYIPMDDPHGSEYVGAHFKCIEFMSGFTGSAGQLIVTDTGAWLYADGRYYIQAEDQLSGSCIELLKLGSRGIPEPGEFIGGKMKELLPLAFGFDGNCVNVRLAEKFISKIAAAAGIGEEEVSVSCGEDLAGIIWKERPAQPFTQIRPFELKYSGEDTLQKLTRIREKIKEETGLEQGYELLISSLDDIAWIFNIRADDIPCNPAAYAYAKIMPDEAVLYIGKDACPAQLRKILGEQGVRTGVYCTEALMAARAQVPEENKTFLMDFGRTSYAVYDSYKAQGLRTKHIKEPSAAMKAVKNETELACAKAALKRDSAVLIEFMRRLKEKAKAAAPDEVLKNDDGTDMSELSVDASLTEMRRKDPLFIELSFNTIAAYGANAAMMHYQAKPESFSLIRARGMLLVDSGCQYEDGTTDITRTFILGPVTEEEKKAFTLTAASMLRLLNAKFIRGCTGEGLDVLAREPMWKEGWDYKCGTGHGVGHVLNVHEGPHAIRWHIGDAGATAQLEPGMIVTDEPGVYREGAFGIRTENELCVKKFCETDDGEFLCFENMTFIPIDLDGIDKKYLSQEDIENLNFYHKMVRQVMEPYLSEETADWLEEYTREI